MSAGDDTIRETIPLPEYEVDQYFPERPELSAEERAQLTEEYGYVRAFFKSRPERHRNLQRWLNQARFGVTFDRYLERSAYYAGAAAAAGLVVGVLFAYLLAAAGVFEGLSSPVSVSGGLAEFVAANKSLFGGGAFALVLGVAFGGVTWGARYYYPQNVISARKQSINVVLPHAIVYMYALSYGGMTLLEVLKKLAAADDAYGDVAREFDMVVRDVELFGNDLFTALRNARNLTPSDEFEQFLDDLVSVLDAGGDVTDFFEEQSQEYLDVATDEQEEFLETLGVLSEVFIVAFVAAPLFLIVILMIISFLGGSSLVQLGVLIYLVLPVAMVAFAFLVYLLSQPYAQPTTVLETEDPRESDVTTADLADDPTFEAYRQANRYSRLSAFLQAPLRAIRDRPTLSTVVTVPLAVVFLLGVVLTGVVSPTLEAFVNAPVATTTYLVVFPLLIVAVPLSLFHEIERGRQNLIARRFPNTLNILSSANQMGIPLVDGLAMVSRWSAGALGEELRKLRNDITWNYDTTQALLRFANRIRVPQLTRTIKLIAEGGKSTGDLSRILYIAAEDTRTRYRLARNRRRAMTSYIAVVVIAFLVYLMVIVLLDVSYLTPIAQTIAEGAPAGPGELQGPFSLQDVPVDVYQLLFFHSAVIQAVGTGMLAGQLANNDLLSGLKYSILLVVVALLTFVALGGGL